MKKILRINKEARSPLYLGANELSDMVKVTMGAAGRNVVAKKNGIAIVTKDGVTVANEIDFADEGKSLGANIIKQAAQNTVREAGDGTTTATVLSQAIINGYEKYKTKKTNPLIVARELKEYGKVIGNYIKDRSQDVSDLESLKRVALISANGDKETADVVAETVHTAGLEGVIDVRFSNDGKTSMKEISGIRLDRGLLDHRFKNDLVRGVSELKDPLILITDKDISTVDDIMTPLKMVLELKRSFLIIADNFDGEALTSCIANTMDGSIKMAAIKSPGIGNIKDEMMEDIALLTGGKYISERLGGSVKDMSFEDFGTCEKMISSTYRTEIIGGDGNQKEIETFSKGLEERMKNIEEGENIDEIRARYSRVAGKSVILNVGGKSEVEMKEKLDRVDDAIHAVRSALEEGIIYGGGRVYQEVSKRLVAMKNTLEEEVARKVLKEALNSPFRQIYENAGINLGKRKYKQFFKGYLDSNIGIDVRTGEITDFEKDGVIDPAKVARVALENAISVSGILITTQGLITEDNGKN
jgi:chaperonin GroEL